MISKREPSRDGRCGKTVSKIILITITKNFPCTRNICTRGTTFLRVLGFELLDPHRFDYLAYGIPLYDRTIVAEKTLATRTIVSAERDNGHLALARAVFISMVRKVLRGPPTLDFRRAEQTLEGIWCVMGMLFPQSKSLHDSGANYSLSPFGGPYGIGQVVVRRDRGRQFSVLFG